MKQIENKHKEVRYSCDQCEYAATTGSNLKQHIKNILSEWDVSLGLLNLFNAKTTVFDLKEKILFVKRFHVF